MKAQTRKVIGKMEERNRISRSQQRINKFKEGRVLTLGLLENLFLVLDYFSLVEVSCF